MDMRCWKKILLQWITECGFTERTYFNIEQSDIDIFYKNFCKHHPKAENNSNTTDAADGNKQNLIAFLHEYYPDFDPNLDDENALSSADYIYVYSLLLHFCCVKYPESYFHEICQKLSELAQQIIASFFKELLDNTIINKEKLRQAIADIVSANLSPCINESLSGSKNSSTGSGSGSLSRSFQLSNFDRLDSPAKTPTRHLNTSQRISPSTPKTFLLEERTRELYNLRAQLETERYEKGLLEVQIKQNEDKILKLNQDHRKLQQQIQDLKNDILTKNTENSSPNRGSDEQIKRRLCKEISQKEQEISKLTDVLSTLKEDKNLVQEKLTFAEKQIALCVARLKELDYKVEELNTELEQKNGTIKYLSDSKLELEQFISETRHRPDNSIDAFDSSFSRATNSSGSVSSPENLGCSVIDIQLREKEYENIQLREELEAIRSRNKSLTKEIHDLTNKHVQEFEINLEQVIAQEEENDDPTDNFMIFATCMDKLTQYYKDEKSTVQKLQQEANVIDEKNTELTKQLEIYEKEMRSLRERIHSVEQLNAELHENNERLQEKLKVCTNELELLSKQKIELGSNLEILSHEYYEYKSDCESHRKDFLTQIEKLQTDMHTNNKVLDKKSETNLHLQSELELLQNKFIDCDSRLKSLNDKMLQQKQEIHMHQTAEQKVKEKYEKLLIAYEGMKKDKRESDDHLEAMRNEIAVKELEMSRLGSEIVEVSTKNEELEHRINKLMFEYQTEKQNSDIAINHRDERIKEIGGERSKLQALLSQAHKELENMQSDIQQSNDELQTISEKVTTINALLKVPILEKNLSANMDDLLNKVHQLVEYQHEASKKIEYLEIVQSDACTKLQETENRLQSVMEDNMGKTDKYEQDIAETKQQLKVAKDAISDYERRIDHLKDEQNRLTERMEHELASREEELVQQMTQTHNELQAEKEYHASKERELKILTAEHDEVKTRLSEREQQLEQIQQENTQLRETYGKKMAEFETKLEAFTTENLRLVDEINAFKEEHSKVEQRLLSANEIVNELTDRLEQECANSSNLLEAKNKLESLLTEKTTSLDELSVELKNYEDQVQKLQLLRTELVDTIGELHEKLQNVSSDKDRWMKEAAEFTAQLQREQAEKSVLLSSLEKTADQVKCAAAEKNKQVVSLEQHCNDLQASVREAREEVKRLQLELQSKEAELSSTLSQQQQDRDEWQSQLSEIMRKMAQQSADLESNEMELIEIIAVLENNANICAELEKIEISNIFNVNSTENRLSSFNMLKDKLNVFVCNLMQLDKQYGSVDKERKEVVDRVVELEQTNDQLNRTIKQNKVEINELQKMLEDEAAILESKLGNQVKRLNDEVQNLENVNEKVTCENTSLHLKVTNLEEEIANAKFCKSLLEEQMKKLCDDQKFNMQVIANLQQDEKRLSENLKERQSNVERLEKKCEHLEQQLKEKGAKLSTAEHALQKAGKEMNREHAKMKEIEHLLDVTTKELHQLDEKYHQELSNNMTLENDLAKRNREFINMENQIVELSNARKHLEDQFKVSSQRLDASIADKLTNETKYEQLLSQFRQLQRDYEYAKTQNQAAHSDVDRLSNEVEALKNEKLQINTDLKDCKRELQRSNDNVTELIQQVASIRLEKESIADENSLLRKQLEENGKNQTHSESKLKSINERSQSLERKLLASENELKSIQSNLRQLETNSEKLTTENKKLRDSNDSTMKRLEKMAIKLGDVQASCAKYERENDKLMKALEANKHIIEILQREKDNLQGDSKQLKERLSKAERMQEQLVAKVHTLEQTNAVLVETKRKLEVFELDGKTKLIKLERLRETNEDKIRKLTNSLNNSENMNVRLNLEIGALNLQLTEMKNNVKSEQAEQVEEITKSLVEFKEKAHSYEELSERLEGEVEKLREENANIADRFEKVTLSLQIANERCDSLEKEIENLHIELSSVRDDKLKVDEEHKATYAKLKEFQTYSEKLNSEKRALIAESEKKVAQLEAELEAKTAQIHEMQKEIESLRSTLDTEINKKTSEASTTEMESLRARLAATDATLEKEQKATAQLRLDNEILHAKYRESKQRLLDETKASEERIKEHRLELEGKLEKMKNKMKTLYTEETTKMKNKQEREMAITKTEMDAIKLQNSRYEEHIRKLSNQIVRLNDNILDHQKQNAILATKLRHLEDVTDSSSGSGRFKRPTAVITASVAPAHTSSANNLGTNLAMEDEEGEIFNNTYLADLKCGRMSEYMSKDICAEELQYRNSLLPPHLKSTYAAQYDHHDIGEDELKDGPIDFDDSTSALLSNTASIGVGNGIRKKLSGVTHYKRPGPPTPSKNGGRLSFGACSLGGNSEPPREILKETYDDGNGNSNGNAITSKTPARFGFFSSRFSMGGAGGGGGGGVSVSSATNAKDEQQDDLVGAQRWTPGTNLRKALQKRNLKDTIKATGVHLKNRPGVLGGICTSTPRKSKTHFDQRRLLEQILSSPGTSASASSSRQSSAGFDNNNNNNNDGKPPSTVDQVSFIETPVSTHPTAAGAGAGAAAQPPLVRVKMFEQQQLQRKHRSSLLRRRLSRNDATMTLTKMKDTTNTSSSANTNTPASDRDREYCTPTAAVAGNITGSAGRIIAALQQRVNRRQKRQRGTRPSLILRGNQYVKYSTPPNRVVIRDLHRLKAHRQRLDNFNKYRMRKSFIIQELMEQSDIVNDVSNVLRKKSPADKSDKDIKAMQTRTEFDESSYIEPDSNGIIEITAEDDIAADDGECNGEEDEGEENDHNHDASTLDVIDMKDAELITTQDLLNFDQQLLAALRQSGVMNDESAKKAKKEKQKYENIIKLTENAISAGDSKYFEHLLSETESQAPFEVNKIQFATSTESSSTTVFSSSRSVSSIASTSLVPYSSTCIAAVNDAPTVASTTTTLSVATPHLTTDGKEPHLSRIIYGGSIIYNHRIPNINTTYVRKSSIYIRKKHNNNTTTAATTTMHDDGGEDEDGIILLTNQTITLVDLIRMWKQMNRTTRLIVFLILMASITSLVGIFIALYWR